MKTKNNKIKHFGLTLAVVAFGGLGLFYSCEKQVIRPMADSPDPAYNIERTKAAQVNLGACGEVMVKQLKIDGRRAAATAYIYNTERSFVVKVIAADNYALGSTYLYTGQLERIPMTEEGDFNFYKFNHMLNDGQFVKERFFRVQLRDLNNISDVSLVAVVKMGNNPNEFARPFKAWIDGDANNQGEGSSIEFMRSFCAVDDKPSDGIVNPGPREEANSLGKYDDGRFPSSDVEDIDLK